jgi:hypothetical protein
MENPFDREIARPKRIPDRRDAVNFSPSRKKDFLIGHSQTAKVSDANRRA